MESGLKALGKKVPKNRLNKGYEAVKEMMPNTDKETIYHIVAKTANFIETDMPFEIVGAEGEGLDKDLSKLDLTGRYRLLATLLSD